MGLFNRNKVEVAAPAVEQPTPTQEIPVVEQPARQYPEVREEDFIDTSDPNNVPKSSVGSTASSTYSVEYTLGMPIDGVYIYMERDWEAEGVKNATENPDSHYMESKIEIIKQGLQRRFELTRLKYNKMIREFSSEVDNLNQFGLTGTMSQLNAQIETCKEHLDKLQELEEKFKREDPALTSMIESYKRGFSFGVARRAQDMIKDNSYRS